MKTTISGVILACVAIGTCSAQVQVWQGTLPLPVYGEGAPDPNPPFDIFESTKFDYPYTLRASLTNKKETQHLRALFLENEYLKCSVLPDIGGHLYSCTDKINGREMFYANPSIKKALIGYRGAWAAFGIEFNFPVSHNWASMSPVDFAFDTNDDGSGSVWVANTDRVYGMRWIVELRLRPGAAVLEEHITLQNPTPVRHRFYWWNNAGIEVWDDSKIWYPMQFAAAHGFASIDTWPISTWPESQAGTDKSVIRNQKFGPVSEFVHGSREPYMGVYHPHTNAGTVHYAEYDQLPAKKIWSWGVDPEGLAWRTALSDNNSAYVEVQGGLFRNQETYSFLEPQQTIRFSEYWMPVRGIGGITRANLNGVVYMTRPNDKQVSFGLNVNREFPHATVRVREGDRLLKSIQRDLSPRESVMETMDAGTDPCTVEVLDANGAVLLAHTEGKFDWTPKSEIKVGPQPRPQIPPPDKRSETDWLSVGTENELNGKLLVAYSTYTDALKHFPSSEAIHLAAGRLATTLKRFDEAQAHLAKAGESAEANYYRGVAEVADGNDEKARGFFVAASADSSHHAGAEYQLAQLEGRQARWEQAIQHARNAKAVAPTDIFPAVLELALLRRIDPIEQNIKLVDRLSHQDPTNLVVRYELNSMHPTLKRHLGADPERVLDIACFYLNAGLYQEAEAVLADEYPPASPLEEEAGFGVPQHYPLVEYFRAYVRGKMNLPDDDAFKAASKLPTKYVFPHRAEALPVLKAALAFNPKDATAHFLLGSLYLSGGMVDKAVSEWQTARNLNSKIPVLDRNLGRVLLEVKHDPQAALAVFQEGTTADPSNTEIYTGATAAMAVLGKPASERVAMLQRYPDQKNMPVPLVEDLALSLAEAGHQQQAEETFLGRYFPSEEGGLDVRQVWAEVRIRNCVELARKGEKGIASALLGTLTIPIKGVPFSKEGLANYFDGPRAWYYEGVAADAAGQHDLARQYWKKAAESDAGPQVAFSYRAAKQLGSVDEAHWHERLTKALTHADEALAEGPNNVSMWHYYKGILLSALGDSQNARKELVAALESPDSHLSHYYARTEMGR